MRIDDEVYFFIRVLKVWSMKPHLLYTQTNLIPKSTVFKLSDDEKR